MKRGTPIDARYPHKLLQKEISAWYGISPQAVRAWDCPRNKDGTYDARAVSAWRDQRIEREAAKGAPAASTGEASAKQRRAEADAEMREIDLAERKGELVMRDEVTSRVERAFAALADLLMAIPRALPAKLDGLTTKEMHPVIEGEMRRAVEEFRRGYSDDD